MHKHWQGVAQMALIERATNSSGPKETYAAPIIETVDTQMAMLQSDAMPQRTLAWLQSNVSPRDPRLDVSKITAQGIQHSILVSNSKDTDVIQVTADAPSRGQAALLADATCQAFLSWKRDIARQQVSLAVNSLAARSAKAEAAMNEAERQETAFKNSHHVTDPAQQEKALLDQAHAQETETNTLQQETLSLKARLTGLNSQIHAKNAHIQSSGGVRDDALVTSLQTQLDQLKSERAEAGQKYTAKYPGLLSGMDAKIHDTRTRLDTALQGILSGKATTLQSQSALLDEYQKTQDSETYTEAKLATARHQADALHAQVTAMPALDDQYNKIERSVQLTRDLYLSLQPDLAAARADLDRVVGSVQIMQNAVVPVQPFRPNKAQNLALGGLAGLFLASLAVIVLENGDRRVRDRADVLRLTPGVILGSLPPLSLSGKSMPPLVGQTYRRAYANLLLALRQSGQESDLQQAVILVTSAIPGEGKSLTAAELARAVAASGKRTILVDADLQTPPEGREVPTTRPAKEALRAEPYGLSDVLEGTLLPAEALAATSQHHLLRLGQGRALAGAEEMASQPKMLETLKALRDCADIVIIDAPACSERADALFLAPHVDCIVQVIGAGKVDAGALQQTSEALAAAQPSLLAYFLNFSPEQNVSHLSAADTGAVRRRRRDLVQSSAEAMALEKDIIEDNRTTEVVVQHVPGGHPIIRLARGTAAPSFLPPEQDDMNATWLHLEDHVTRHPR